MNESTDKHKDYFNELKTKLTDFGDKRKKSMYRLLSFDDDTAIAKIKLKIYQEKHLSDGCQDKKENLFSKYQRITGVKVKN